MGLLDPDLYYTSLYSVDLDGLESRGIRGIILDLDNTILPLGALALDDRACDWVSAVISRFGLCIVSNNRHEHPLKIARDHGVPIVPRALKPTRRGFMSAMRILGTKPAETAVIGDQVFTDVLGGNRVGALTVLVGPLGVRDLPHTRALRLVEARIMSRRTPLA